MLSWSLWTEVSRRCCCCPGGKGQSVVPWRWHPPCSYSGGRRIGGGPVWVVDMFWDEPGPDSRSTSWWLEWVQLGESQVSLWVLCMPLLLELSFFWQPHCARHISFSDNCSAGTRVIHKTKQNKKIIGFLATISLSLSLFGAASNAKTFSKSMLKNFFFISITTLYRSGQFRDQCPASPHINKQKANISVFFPFISYYHNMLL